MRLNKPLEGSPTSLTKRTTEGKLKASIFCREAMKYRKSKKERRKWWNNLSPEQQSEFVERKCKDKAAKRAAELMSDSELYGLKYDCNQCILGISDSCTAPQQGGCGFFYDPSTNEQGFYLNNKVHVN